MNLIPAMGAPGSRAGHPDTAPASAQEGCAAAVTVLYREHALGLTRLAHVMLGNRAAAEDVVQEAFCGLYRRWQHLTDTDRALQYLRSSVLNGWPRQPPSSLSFSSRWPSAGRSQPHVTKVRPSIPPAARATASRAGWTRKYSTTTCPRPARRALPEPSSRRCRTPSQQRARPRRGSRSRTSSRGPRRTRLLSPSTTLSSPIWPGSLVPERSAGVPSADCPSRPEPAGEQSTQLSTAVIVRSAGSSGRWITPAWR
jgi:sigma-70-like protein